MAVVDYDVIIIGTGFGATVAATQLAKHNLRVLMLERGLWWNTPERQLPAYFQPGNPGEEELKLKHVQYWPRPDNSNSLENNGLLNFLSVVRAHNTPLAAIAQSFLGGEHPPEPLYHYHMFDSIDIISAGGVGGGSLIYSNVTIEPHFEDNRYPVMDRWPRNPDGSQLLNKDDYRKALAWMEKYRGKLNKVVTRTPVTDPKLSVDNLPPEYEFLYLGKSRALRNATKQLEQDPNPSWKDQIAQAWRPLTLQVYDDAEAIKKEIPIAPSPAGISRTGKIVTVTTTAAHGVDEGVGVEIKGAKSLSDDKKEFDVAGTVTEVLTNTSFKFTTDDREQDGNSGDGKLVVFTDAGKNKAMCERQGRCFLGCLPAARHTLNKTLINPGFGIFAGPKRSVHLISLAEVQDVAPIGNDAGHFGWEVSYVKDSKVMTKRAWVVVVSAGCLGSTKLLLRQRNRGTLHLSDKVGKNFSSNGDFAAFARLKAPDPGFPTKNVRDNVLYPAFPSRGPINTSHVIFKDARNNLFINVEDGGIPAMFSAITRTVLDTLESIRPTGIRNKRKALKSGDLKQVQDMWVKGKPASFKRLKGPYHEPDELPTEQEMTADLFFFNCQGTDSGDGEFSLSDSDELDLKYNINQYVYTKIEEICKAITARMCADYIPFPLSEGLAGVLPPKALTVHPLGGCVMGRSASEGVVDLEGRVFNTSPNASESTYAGMFAMDASVVPGPVAVNPTLTIVALALKIAPQLEAYAINKSQHPSARLP